jgi:prolyl-tRNA synthetase
LTFRAENTTEVDTYDEFKRLLDEQPGFIGAIGMARPKPNKK